MEVAGAVARTDAAGGLLDPLLRQVLDGALVEGSGDEVVIVDPTTSEVLARGPVAGVREVDLAVKTARRAQDRLWGRVAGLVRTRHMLALARLVADHADEMAALEALDTGTPLRQVHERGISTAQAHLLHHAGWADKLVHAGLGAPTDGGNPRPAGVSLHLFGRAASLSDVVRTVAPALGTGCTVVVAAPETTPLATLALGRLALQAGLPPGVLTVLAVNSSTWPRLIGRDAFDVVTSTGSASAAATAQRALVGTATRLHTDVRGDQVVIALGEDDPTRNAAVAHAVSGLCTHGRRLAGALRLLVPAPDLDATLDQLRTRLAALVVGDPLAPTTDVGPLADLALLDDAALTAAPRSWTAVTPIPSTGSFLAPSFVAPCLVADADGTTTGRAPGPVLLVDGYVDLEHLRRLVGGDRHATLRLMSADPASAQALGTSLRGRTTVGTDHCPEPGLIRPTGYLGG
ncbi:MAG: aldehyde dehydrogenase family protein [Mycobacteriaceae bacterium]